MQREVFSLDQVSNFLDDWDQFLRTKGQYRQKSSCFLHLKRALSKFIMWFISLERNNCIFNNCKCSVVRVVNVAKTLTVECIPTLKLMEEGHPIGEEAQLELSSWGLSHPRWSTSGGGLEKKVEA
eukprot:Gb_20586 [translate_table: standard]